MTSGFRHPSVLVGLSILIALMGAILLLVGWRMAALVAFGASVILIIVDLLITIMRRWHAH